MAAELSGGLVMFNGLPFKPGFILLPDGSIWDGKITTGDIEIGAVELKDATTDNRLALSNADLARASTVYGLASRVVGLLETLGEVQALPTANTLLARLRDLNVLVVSSGKQSFQRPGDTTPYVAGDLIANSTTAGSVTRLAFTGATKTGNGGTGRIAKLVASKSASAACSLRYHFLKTDHAVTNGDNGALVLTSLDVDNYIGAMDVVFNGTNDAIGSSASLVNRTYDAPLDYVLSSGDTIYAVVEALTGYTPGNAEVYTVKPTFEVFS